MKTCSRCRTPKKEEEFSWKNKTKGTKQSHCKRCHSEYLSKHYVDNKQKYLDYGKGFKERLKIYIQKAKEKPCAECGKEYPYYVMDFDHRDGGEKSFILSQHHKIGSYKKVQEEIDKCDVVCANCHRERTFGRVRVNG